MVLSRQAEPRRSSVADRLSTADTLLRIVFSALIISLFVLSIRLFFLNRQLTVPNEYVPPGANGLVENTPSGLTRTELALKAFPLPIMPGAKRTTGVKMEFNGGDFIRIEFDTSARPARALSFYRNWLRKQGWRDWVEDSYRPRHGGSFGQIAGLPGGMQDESLLRFYDQMQRDQVNFAKGDKRASVFAKPSEKRRNVHRIAVQYMEHGSPESISRMTGRGRYKPIMQFSEERGGDLMQTRFIQDRKSPKALHRTLVARFRRQGWELVVLPKPVGEGLPENYVQMARGPELLYMQVAENSDDGGAIATVTTVSSRAR